MKNNMIRIITLMTSTMKIWIMKMLEQKQILNFTKIFKDHSRNQMKMHFVKTKFPKYSRFSNLWIQIIQAKQIKWLTLKSKTCKT